MKHAWMYVWNWEGDHRYCQNCGAVQHKTRDYAWGRVISIRWSPLAGKCQPNATAVEATLNSFYGEARP